MEIINVYELTGNEPLSALVGRTFKGGRFTLPGARPIGTASTITFEGKQYTFYQLQSVTPAQFGQWYVPRAVALTSISSTLNEGLGKIRKDFVHGNESDERAIERMRRADAEPLLNERLTPGDAVDTATRMAMTILEGGSFGRGQEHMDAKLKVLPQRIRETLAEQLLSATTRGELSLARDRVQKLLGRWNRSSRDDAVAGGIPLGATAADEASTKFGELFAEGARSVTSEAVAEVGSVDDEVSESETVEA